MNQRNSGILLMVYATMMLAFACLWHFALPFHGDLANYRDMVSHEYWPLINTIGWIAVPIGIFAIVSLHHSHEKNVGWSGRSGFILVISAFFIHGCLLSWETFIWPEIADNIKAVFLITEGVFLQSRSIVLLYSLFSLTFALGFVLLGTAWLKTRLFPKAAVIMIMAGASIYALAVAFGGYTGLIAFTMYLTGLFYIGLFNLGSINNGNH